MKIKNFLIGLAVTVVLAAGLTILELSNGVSPSMIEILIPVAVGAVVSYCLQMMSGNRKELRVDDAARQASLSAVAPAGQALLYIYREGFVGKAVGWNVSLDGAALAQLRSPRFTQTVVSPGSHSLTFSLSSPSALGGTNKSSETAFEAQPGEVIVFAMKVKMGATSGTPYTVREQDTHAALQKLSKIPMVAAERAGVTAAS